MAILHRWAVASVLLVLALMLGLQIFVVAMLRGLTTLEPLGYLIWGGLTVLAAGAAWLMWKARVAGFRGVISEILWLTALGELAVTVIGWVIYYRRY